MTIFKKSKTSKVVSGFVGVMAAAMLIPGTVSAAALTQAQVDAIVSLLQSFGADATTIMNVQSSLTGQPVVGGGMTGGTSGGYVFSVDLTVGSTGADVVALQQILVAGGHLVMPAGVAMGNFGNLTKAAVMKWQASAGISPAAGYVGPKSRAALNAMGGGTTGGTTGGGTTGGTTGGVVGGGVSAMLGTGAAVALMSGQTSGQGVATIAVFKLMNGGTAPVKVTMLKFMRTGISSDSTLSNVYLYQGAMRLTDAGSIASGMVNFTDTAGLVTIPAGGSVEVAVRGDVAALMTGQVIGFALTEVTTDGGAVSGLPVAGPNITIAAMPTGGTSADLTGITSPATGSIDPQTDYTVWQRTVSIGSRDALLSAVRFQQIGSAYGDDVQNFRLMVDGVAVGTAVAKVDGNRFVSFAFNPPFALKAGSHVVKVVADVVGGSNRNFQFSLRRVVDIEIWDSQLNIVVTPTVGNAAFAAVDAGVVSVNPGTITITKSTDSPSGNVVLNGSSVTLAKWMVKGQGEKLKVENLSVNFTGTTSPTQLRNAALFLNGVQIGSTASLLATAAGTLFNLGSSMVLEPGKENTLELRADVFNNGSNSATNAFLAGNTITVGIVVPPSANVYRMSSLGYIANTAVPANQVTVASGSLSLAKYSAYANQTVVVPQTAYKIGEFRLTGGSTEGVNIDTLTLAILGNTLATADLAASRITDLYIVYGAKTTTSKATGAASQTFSVNEALAANGTLDVKVYATLSSAMNTGAVASTTLVVSGTSQSSGGAVTSGAATVGQEITVGAGSLAAALDASTPVAANVVANSMPKLASFKYTATNDAFTITDVGVTVGSLAGAAAISEIVFKDGATELRRVAMNGVNATGTSLNVAVAYNSTKIIDVYAQLGGIGTGFATTSSNVAVTHVATKYKNSSGATLWLNPVTGNAGNATYAFKTKPTITNVALPTTLLTASTMAIGKFTVTADAGGTLAWKKLILAVASSTGVATNGVFNIYDSANESTPLSGVTFGYATTTGLLTFTSSVDQEVSGSKTYIVKTTLQNGSNGGIVTGSTISTNIPTGVASYSAPGANGVVAGGSSFTWSDESQLGHSLITNDWFDDFLVKNIPTDSQTLTK